MKIACNSCYIKSINTKKLNEIDVFNDNYFSSLEWCYEIEIEQNSTPHYEGETVSITFGKKEVQLCWKRYGTQLNSKRNANATTGEKKKAQCRETVKYGTQIFLYNRINKNKNRNNTYREWWKWNYLPVQSPTQQKGNPRHRDRKQKVKTNKNSSE